MIKKLRAELTQRLVLHIYHATNSIPNMGNLSVWLTTTIMGLFTLSNLQKALISFITGHQYDIKGSFVYVSNCSQKSFAD